MSGYEVVFSVFCGRVIIDRDTSSLTLVDAIPFLSFGMSAAQLPAEGPIQLGLTPFTYLACLRRTDLTNAEEMSLNLKASVKIGEEEASVDLPGRGIAQNAGFGYITVNINTSALKFPNNKGRQNSEISLRLLDGDKEVDHAVIPVIINIVD